MKNYHKVEKNPFRLIATIFDKDNTTESTFSIVPEKIDETSYFFRDKRDAALKIETTESIDKEVEKIISIEKTQLNKTIISK